LKDFIGGIFPYFLCRSKNGKHKLEEKERRKSGINKTVKRKKEMQA
jgi:hypothetical protein